MKRLSSEQRAYRIRRDKKRCRRLAKEVPSKIRRHPVGRQRRRISAPAVFELGTPDNREKVMAFLRQLERALANGGSVTIVFHKTKALYPCGTLLFVAKLDVLLATYPGRITSDYPANPTVHELFQHIGILKWLGKAPQVQIDAENVKHWCLKKGTTIDMGIVRALFTEYEENLASDVSRGLYASMSEAVANAIEHAYEGRLAKSERKGWWMFAEQRDGNLVVAVCDLGIGIPESLNRKFLEHVRALVSPIRRKDSWFINQVVTAPRTRTDLKNRGKGLQEMLEFVEQADVGAFIIYSLRGSFAYSRDKDKRVSSNYRTRIPGTLIQWKLPLTKQKQTGLSDERLIVIA